MEVPVGEKPHAETWLLDEFRAVSFRLSVGQIGLPILRAFEEGQFRAMDPAAGPTTGSGGTARAKGYEGPLGDGFMTLLAVLSWRSHNPSGE